MPWEELHRMRDRIDQLRKELDEVKEQLDKILAKEPEKKDANPPRS